MPRAGRVRTAPIRHLYFFSKKEKLLIRLFLRMEHHVPSVPVSKMIEKMRQDGNRAIIGGEAQALLSTCSNAETSICG